MPIFSTLSSHGSQLVKRKVWRKMDLEERASFVVPRSPDLTLLDFYFWGRLKQLFY
jgi:hypothetical protein